MDLKDTYNKIALDWYRDHQNDGWWVDGTNAFISFLPAKGSVLDVGCAGGYKARYLAKRGLKITGIDFSENFIEIAKKESPGLEFFVRDLRQLDGLPQYDGVFAQASLLHIPKAQIHTVLTGLKNRIKMGGFLYIAVKGKKENGPEEETLEEKDYGYTYYRQFSYFSEDELREYLKSIEMEIVYENVKQWGTTTWLQIIGKRIV